VNLFGVVSFVHDVEIGMSDPVTLFGEFFSVRDVMDRMPGYLQTGYNLSISVN